MKRIITLLFLFALSISAQSLSKVYTVCEGSYSISNSAALSMLAVTQGSITEDIFTPGNLGSFPDGLVIYNDSLYLVAQGSYGSNGIFYQLDTLGTVTKSATVGINPYSLAIANDKAYLTNGPDYSVSVVNLDDFSIDTTITVGVYPQEIVSYNDYVFVANTRLYINQDSTAVDSTVIVIDSKTDEIIDTIVVEPDPAALAISNDGYLLIGCSVYGYGSNIYKVDPSTFAIVDTFTITDYGFNKDISVDKNSDKIYFLGSNYDVVSLDLETEEVAQVVAGSNFTYPYGYAYDYVNQVHYVADAKDFSANGSLASFGSDGTQINSYTTGIAPRRIVLKYSGTATGVDDDEQVIAKGFNLNQNYPNPFNPTTVISFSIPQTSQVNLTVYNVLGQKVKELVNKELNAGDFEINFNASNLASGIYYYRIQAGSYVATKKMMLVK